LGSRVGFDLSGSRDVIGHVKVRQPKMAVGPWLYRTSAIVVEYGYSYPLGYRGPTPGVTCTEKPTGD